MTNSKNNSTKWTTLAGVIVAAALMAMPNSATAETAGQASTSEFAPPQSDCPSDLNGDGTVDSDDLGALLVHYGKCRGCAEDLSGDSNVSQEDIDILMSDWGPCEEYELGADDATNSSTRSAEYVAPAPTYSKDDSDDADTCVGDLDGDGEVGPADLAIILVVMDTECKNCDEDIFSDGYVDITDVLILMLGWGPCNEASVDTGATPTGRSIAKAAAPVYDFTSVAEESKEDEKAVCTGDLDGDGEVGPNDLAIVMTHMGENCRNCLADVDGDHEVGTTDMLTVLIHWGPCE